MLVSRAVPEMKKTSEPAGKVQGFVQQSFPGTKTVK